MKSLTVRNGSITTIATYAPIPGTDRIAVHLVHVSDQPECKRRNRSGSAPQRPKPRRSVARVARRIIW
jgi:hypothetical protein